MKLRQNKMINYLAVTAGVGCVSSAANAAVVFYGNATNNSILPDPTGLYFRVQTGAAGPGGYFRYVTVNLSGGTFSRNDSFTFFTGGADIVSTGASSVTRYMNKRVWGAGASAGSSNFANINFNTSDSNYEAVAQFFLNGDGTGYLMAIAMMNAVTDTKELTNVGGPNLSISAGKAMIVAANGVTDLTAAVPEPSSLLLFALGATGLAARRQRRKAA